MRIASLAIVTAVFCAAPLFAQENKSPDALNEVVSKIVAREKQEMDVIRQRSPLVETYIQRTKMVERDGSWQPDGDHYFIGQAELSKGIDLVPLQSPKDATVRHAVGHLTQLFNFSPEFLPKGFLQMIYLDNNGLDTQNYHFDYVRREFLGEVRTLVFDVTPAKKKAKGRFVGRIWVEDQAYTIVRFNGSYSGNSNLNLKFHFDSWRVNAGPDLWLPAFIYSEENTPGFAMARTRLYKAQTRLWGYNAGQGRQEEELSKVLIESGMPVVDKSTQDTDLSPIQQKRAWDLQAQDNIVDTLQGEALVAPEGEVDKVLDTVINNLEVTNNLNFDPEIRCRILMTSTIESFSFGRTIVLSRGLIDVLPDEASLAAILAKELGYIMLAHPMDTRFAFYDRLFNFDEKTVFQHFDFTRSPQDEAAANAKAAELLSNSPYKDQLGTAVAFIAELQDRSREIPNLISPHLGDLGLLKLPVAPKGADDANANHIVALPLGGRVKLNPWDDRLELLKSKTVGNVAEREKMPFEITPFEIYLTRVPSDNPKSSQFNLPSPENRSPN
jgi:hypothetical protein